MNGYAARGSRFRSTSYFWNGFIRSLTWISREMGWKVGYGNKIRLGIDLIVGLNYSFILSKDLRSYLVDYGICILNNAQNEEGGRDSRSYWLSAEDLELEGIWKEEWTGYINGLSQGGIRLKETQDTLLWMHNTKNGEVTARLAYDLIVSSDVALSKNKT